MSKLLRNQLTLLTLVSEDCQYDSDLEKLLIAAKDLSAFCNTWFTNEKNVYRDLARSGTDCAILVFINEKSLINTQFRRLFTMLVGTNLRIVILKYSELNNDIVLSYFPYVAKQRLKKIMSLVNKAVIVNSQNFLLSIINRLQHLIKSCVIVRPSTEHKTGKKSILTYEDDLVLQRAKQAVQPCIFSYNPVTKKNHSMKKSLTTTSSPFVIKKPINEKVQKRYFTNKKPLICPTIKISSSDINDKLQRPSSSDGFIESSKNSADFSYSNLRHLNKVGSPVMQLEETLSVDHPDMRSFHHIPLIKEYFLEKENSNGKHQHVPKTYVLFDPLANSKNLLYVNIPHIDNLSLNDVEHHRRARHTSPRSSMLFNSMSSDDFNNIETAYDCVNLFESPIPTPDIKIKSIYHKPIPSFSQEMCFPPVGLFPCETLQSKRPSIFDVLRM